MNRKFVQGVFLLGLSFLVASFGVMSCDHGGGDAGAAPPPAATVDFVVHESTVSGPHTIPGGFAFPLGTTARSITFAPTVGTEVLKIEVQGRQVFIGTAPVLTLHVLDNPLTYLVGDESLTGSASTMYFRVIMWLPQRGFNNVTNYLTRPTSYTIQLFVSNGGGAAGSIDFLKFRIYTAEGVTTIPASAQISG